MSVGKVLYSFVVEKQFYHPRRPNTRKAGVTLGGFPMEATATIFTTLVLTTTSTAGTKHWKNARSVERNITSMLHWLPYTVQLKMILSREARLQQAAHTIQESGLVFT